MVDIEKIRRYLITSLASYRGHSEYDDAFQEGMIRAWRDIEDGNDDFRHVAHRAKLWAVAFISESGQGRRRSTGAPPMSRDGRRDAQGDKTREKIKQCIAEYESVHGEEPTNKYIVQSTGISSSVVSIQRKKMREGKGVNHAIYNGRDRIDHNAYTIGPITLENENDIYGSVTTSFESDLIADMSFKGLLEDLPSEERQVLYWHYVLGLNAKEIAAMLGLAGGSSSGMRKIRAAHHAVKVHLFPEEYQEQCVNGHKRTPENTKVFTNVNGTSSKRCMICQEATRKRQAARRKPRKPREVKTHCKRDHEIRGYKSNRRYCKICNYMSAYPNKTEADIPPESALWKWDEQP